MVLKTCQVDCCRLVARLFHVSSFVCLSLESKFDIPGNLRQSIFYFAPNFPPLTYDDLKSGNNYSMSYSTWTTRSPRPVFNFTNILQAAFAPIFFCQKHTNPSSKHIKAAKTLLYKKNCHKNVGEIVTCMRKDLVGECRESRLLFLQC